MLNSLYSSIYTKIVPDFGFEPQKVNVTKTFEHFGIQILYDIVLENNQNQKPVPVHFPHNGVPMPHVYFKFAKLPDDQDMPW